MGQDRQRTLLESVNEDELVRLKSGTLANFWGDFCVPKVSGGTADVPHMPKDGQASTSTQSGSTLRTFCKTISPSHTLPQGDEDPSRGSRSAATIALSDTRGLCEQSPVAFEDDTSTFLAAFGSNPPKPDGRDRIRSHPRCTL